MAQGTRKFWGWGVAESDLTAEETGQLAKVLSARFGPENMPALMVPYL